MATPHLSPAVRVGDIIYTSGQLAFDKGMITGDIVEQTRQVIANLKAVLADYGLDLNDIAKTTVWVTRQQDFSAFNDTYAAAFGDHKPARSTTICALALPAALVEIEAMAVIKAGSATVR